MDHADDHADDQPETGRRRSAFWSDLAEDMADPVFRAAFEAESLRIQAIDQAVNAAVEAGSDHPDFTSMRPEEIAEWVDRGSPAEQRRALRAAMERLDFTDGEIVRDRPE